MKKIGFIGMGNMASAIAGGIIKSGFIDGKNVYAFDIDSDKLAKRILSNNVLDFISLNDEVEILEVKVPNKYLGKSILDTNIRQNYGLNIIALERADVDKIETRIDPKYIFKEGDCIVVIGEKKSLRKFESLK